MINSPFQRPKNREKFPGVESGDSCYYEREIILEFVQTGLDDKGKAIGSIQPVVHETAKDIAELINSSFNKVGLKNIITRFANTGDDSLFNARPVLPSGDYSTIPVKSAQEIFESLPKELTQGMTLDEFVKNFNSDMFTKFIASIKVEAEKGKEVIENE